ncbi:unnamed protein product [Discosporangium mesarthrocarpum]
MRIGNSQIKGLIFDLYDTLIYIENKTNPFKFLLQKLVIDQQKYGEIRAKLMTRNYDSINELGQELGITDQGVIKKTEELIKLEIDSTNLFAESYEVLEKLRVKYQLYLLSNVMSTYKKPYEDLNLDRLFDRAYFSCDIGLKKPQVEMFEQPLKENKLGVKEVIMIGNSYTSDYLGGISAGIKSILVDRKNLTKVSEDIDRVSNLKELLAIL